MENPTNYRISLLRDFMREKNLHAFIIPSTDAHISEYIPDHWSSRQWISGFTGSSGTVVVTLEKAGLWTDSRYFLQATKELSGSEILLFKDRLLETVRIVDWLKGELTDNDRIGIDGNVYPAKDALGMQCDLKKKKITLVADYDPFETIWFDRPALPKNPISILPVEFTGESASSKIEQVLADVEKYGANAVWISTLDTIAWLFNIRGTDVAYNPVVIAHAFISQNERILFINTEKVPSKIAGLLKSEGVKLVDYCQYRDFIAKSCNCSVCIDCSKISYSVYNAISNARNVVDTPSVADRLKSIKNEVEAEGFRQVMIRDGVALTRFFMWLENAIPKVSTTENTDVIPPRLQPDSPVLPPVTEYDIGLKLKEYRSRQPNFTGESFSTIAGFAANGAINHYHPAAGNCLEIKPEGLLLIDSGGQYLEGTTDITRTVAVGPVNEDMKRDFTLVLKGMIALSKAVFPAGTRGSQLDILARKAMWEHGINYGHGTGHGVGHYLNVHEGPQSIRQEENLVALRTGMTVTNEPGIYRDSQYGVRTENMMLTTHAMTTDYGDFYQFETLSLCYIDTSPLLKEMLTVDEIAWLNNYHQAVYEKLSPHLTPDEKSWLRTKTQAVL